MRLFAAAISSALFVTPVIANPIDMTGMSCVRTLEYGTQTWEFYGDVAIQYFQDGSVKRLPRIGEGAYEKFDRDGEWLAAYYIYDDGDGIKVRFLSRPGLIIREENPTAPLEIGIFTFSRGCRKLWEG